MRVLIYVALLLFPTFVNAQWQYIQIDSTKQKWGDWAEPEWLRYFGLDAGDVNQDGCLDIVSGRYVYHNPCATQNQSWERSVLDDNVDGIFLMDVDGDAYADLIAQALPNIYWYEATDLEGRYYKRTHIATVPATSHVNSQGFEKAQIVAGGKEEILIAGNGNIYCVVLPDTLAEKGKWETYKIAENTSDEGIGFGDIDGDGDLDIAAGRRPDGENEPKILVWFEHPGSLKAAWKDRVVGESIHPIDRVEIADMNGDNKADIIVTEERYPGLEPDGNMYWFEQGATNDDWAKHTIVTQYSMNNLDIGDIDKDGDLDIVTNEHKGKKLELQWWKNDGQGQFTKTVIDIGKENHLGTQLIDIDSDGDLDIIGAAWDHYQYMHLWRNDAIQSSKSRPDQKPLAKAIHITEGTYEDRPHFVIRTPVMTYYYDKAGGGFSRIIDAHGNDWISFKKEPWNQYPASAASAYRGLPNLVFRSDDGGAGHPGFDKCESKVISENEILTTSKSGDWQWRWQFETDHATLQVEKVAKGQSYWFLYEGTPGGKFDVQHQYFGTNQAGPSQEHPDHFNGKPSVEHIQWAYFGHQKSDQVFYLLQTKSDEKPDHLSYLGNTEASLESSDGMTVFGFGRDGNTNALLTQPATFIIGFYPKRIVNQEDHIIFSTFLNEKF